MGEIARPHKAVYPGHVSIVHTHLIDNVGHVNIAREIFARQQFQTLIERPPVSFVARVEAIEVVGQPTTVAEWLQLSIDISESVNGVSTATVHANPAAT